MKIAVVIPCYKVKTYISNVISKIPSIVDKIYVVDDACPEGTASYVLTNEFDSRIVILKHEHNCGVGGAVKTGYLAALSSGYDIVIKIDGDGQADPTLIPEFISPLIDGLADYTKGNRFYNPETLKSMPGIRLFGNSLLSFLNKFSSGYWDIFDPNNGYTAINSKVLRKLPLDKISSSYFFETDMLFRLNLIRARVIDIPMDSLYAGEKSNLKIQKIICEFALKHTRNMIKRILINYYIRDMSIASFQLPAGIMLTSFGLIYGVVNVFISSSAGLETPYGKIMLVALTLILGVVFILSFLNYDIAITPKNTIHQYL